MESLTNLNQPTALVRFCGGIAGAAILFVIPFLLYGVSLGYPLLFLDDGVYFEANPLLAEGRFEGLLRVWSGQHFGYTPFTHTTIWVDVWLRRHLGIDGWWAARLMQFAWVGLGILGVRSLITRLSGCAVTGFVVALLYAVHPLCAPTALWLALRRQAVCLALLYWGLVWFLTARQATDFVQYRRACAATLVLLSLAALSRFNAISALILAPTLVAMVQPTAWRSRPLSYIAVAIPCLGLVAIQAMWTDPVSLSAWRLGGSWVGTLWLDGEILVRYLGNILWPWPLAAYYGVNETMAWNIRQTGAWFVVLGLVAATLVPAVSRCRVMLLWCCALAAIGPTMNLVNQSMAMADHYIQPALPFLFLLTVELARRTGPWFAHGQYLRWPPLVLGLVTLWAVMAAGRNPHFAHSRAFIDQTVVASPDSALGTAWSVHHALNQGGDIDTHKINAQALAAVEAPDLFRTSGMTIFVVLQTATRALAEQGQVQAAHAVLTQHFAALEAAQSLYLRAALLNSEGEPGRAFRILELAAPVDRAELENLWKNYVLEKTVSCPGPAWTGGIQVEPTIINPLANATTETFWRQRTLSTLSRYALKSGQPDLAARYALALVVANPDLVLGWSQFRAALMTLGEESMAQAVTERLALLQTARH